MTGAKTRSSVHLTFRRPLITKKFSKRTPRRRNRKKLKARKKVKIKGSSRKSTNPVKWRNQKRKFLIQFSLLNSLLSSIFSKKPSLLRYSKEIAATEDFFFLNPHISKRVTVSKTLFKWEISKIMGFHPKIIKKPNLVTRNYWMKFKI